MTPGNRCMDFLHWRLVRHYLVWNFIWIPFKFKFIEFSFARDKAELSDFFRHCEQSEAISLNEHTIATHLSGAGNDWHYPGTFDQRKAEIFREWDRGGQEAPNPGFSVMRDDSSKLSEGWNVLPHEVSYQAWRSDAARPENRVWWGQRVFIIKLYTRLSLLISRRGVCDVHHFECSLLTHSCAFLNIQI